MGDDDNAQFRREMRKSWEENEQVTNESSKSVLNCVNRKKSWMATNFSSDYVSCVPKSRKS
jgi:hypothetical protein